MSTNKLAKRSTSTQWREKRREILMCIIATDPSRNWSYRDLAEEMRQNELVLAAQPNYGYSTAYRDWLVVRDELKEKRDELAGEYISTQLDITEGLIEGLMDDWEALKRIDIDDIDTEDDVKVLLSIIAAKKDIVTAVDKVMSRQQTLIPIAVPKHHVVDNNNNINLDVFHQLRRDALAAPAEQDYIEGEIID